MLQKRNCRRVPGEGDSEGVLIGRTGWVIGMRGGDGMRGCDGVMVYEGVMV